MKVKEVNVTANISWSPDFVQPLYIACGTSAQQYDATFNSTSVLQIYDICQSSSSLDMKLLASQNVPAKFNKVLWSGKQNTDVTHPLGIIVGGCDNGSVYLYSAEDLINKKDAVIGSMEGKHAGPVFAFDFNHQQPNLLATGSSECEILIWDIKDTSNPMTPGAKPTLSADVTDLSWNRQVEHIMASTYGGRCVVYDLRKSASIIQIVESVSRMKAHSVKWHPTVATQLILSSNDDASPFGQVWDLRFATTPLKSLEGHQRGIVATAWCTQDPDLFITSGKDNKIYMWNPNNERGAEIVGEFPSYNQWSFDVSWSERDPSLVATTSVDGVVSVYSVLGAGIPPVQNNKFSAIADSFPGMEMPTEVPHVAQPQSIYLRYPPKWFPKKCGARFGFGGKLISWDVTDRSVKLFQVITEPEFVSRSSQLEEALSRSDLPTFCQSKVHSATDSNEKVLWSFLSASFEPSPRTTYMNLLGFIPDQVACLVRPQDSAIRSEDLTDKMANLGTKSLDENSSSIDPSEQFEMIASEHSDDKTPEIEVPSDFVDDDPLLLSIGEDAEGMIRHALLLADFASAVELCLKQNKNSIALIIASYAGPELFAMTQDRVLKNEKVPGLSPLLKSIVHKDLFSLASKCDLSDWKEAFVAILTYATEQEISPLIECLGDRLESEGTREELHSAVLCFLSAGNLDKFVSSLSKTKPSPTKTKNPSLLLDLVEIVVVLQRALSSTGRSVNFSEGSSASSYICTYASLLASQGALSNAVTYLSAATQGEMVELRDRLYRCLGYPTGSSRAAPRLRSSSSSSQSTFRKTSTPLSNQFTMSGSPMQPQHPNVGIANTSFHHTAPPMPQQPVNFVMSQPTAAVPPTFGVAPMSQHTHFQLPALQPTGPPPLGQSSGPGGFRKTALSTRYSQETPVDPMSAPSAPLPGMFTPAHIPHQVVQPNAHIPTMPLQPDMNPSGRHPASRIGQHGPTQEVGHSEEVGTMVTPAAYDSNIPRGWNDPPPISGSRKEKSRLSRKHDEAIADPAAPNVQGFMVPEAPKQFSGFQSPTSNVGMGGAPTSSQAPQVSPLPKKPLPAEHLPIQDVFSRLREKGMQSAMNPAAKQRLEDLSVKLEVLYDKIRENQIGANTLKGLHDITDAIRAGDYYRALQLHSATINTGNFSEMSQFMPAVKMLITTCMQCQIFYQ